MRDDLLDAQACVDWAVTQIPLFRERLLSWQSGNPYHIVVEYDPQTNEDLVVAIEKTPLPRVLNVEIGAIVNTLRSGLDLLAATLSRRNSIVPKSKTYFPICRSLGSFRDKVKMIESEQWLSKAQIKTIEGLKPYKGGDKYLWPLAKLDNLRKHERLIMARPDAFGSLTIGAGEMRVTGSLMVTRERMNDKTILFRGTPGTIDLSQGNFLVAINVVFGEPCMNFDKTDDAAEIALIFASRVSEVISLFDDP